MDVLKKINITALAGIATPSRSRLGSPQAVIKHKVPIQEQTAAESSSWICVQMFFFHKDSIVEAELSF
jgi:hypothetical protein